MTYYALVIVDWPVASAAGWVEPPGVRSLDAIHLATARRLEVGLEAVVTYDRRMVEMAGLRVASPRDEPA